MLATSRIETNLFMITNFSIINRFLELCKSDSGINQVLDYLIFRRIASGRDGSSEKHTSNNDCCNAGGGQCHARNCEPRHFEGPAGDGPGNLTESALKRGKITFRYGIWSFFVHSVCLDNNISQRFNMPLFHETDFALIPGLCIGSLIRIAHGDDHLQLVTFAEA